jgi:hypothetical protein
MTRRRLGRCIRRAMERGAMTSGGETMAPNMKPTGQGIPNSQWVTTATAMVVNATQPTASSEMGRRLNRNSRQLILTADEYMTGGNTKSSTSSGESSSVGRPGMSARATLVSTSRMAGSRAVATATDATMTSSNTSIWMVGTMSAQPDNTSRSQLGAWVHERGLGECAAI